MSKTYAFAGTVMKILVGSQETGGSFSVLHVTKPDGSSTPPHSHDIETEISYVLGGTLSVETEDKIVDVEPDETVVLPPRRPHRLFNKSGKMVTEYLLCTPAHFDGFVAAAGVEVEAAAVPRPMTPEDRQRLVELASQYGISLLPSATPPDHASMEAPSKLEVFDILGLRVEVLKRLGSADNDLVLTRQSLAGGRDFGLHSHTGAECVFVVKGKLNLYKEGDGWISLDPNQAAYIPGGMKHALRNCGKATAVILTVTTVQMAAFFAKFGAPSTGAAARKAKTGDMSSLVGEVPNFGYWGGSANENKLIGLPESP